MSTTSTLNFHAQPSTFVNAASLGSTKTTFKGKLVLLLLSISLWPAIGQSQSIPLQPVAREAPTEQSSYVNRVLKRQGVHDADPNVYLYTAEFAKRFQMPEEWVSDELKGVDAVAFRVVPHLYKTCGWGGDPKACNANEVRCEMDLYFDHKLNPLPWDDRLATARINRGNTTAGFIASNANPLALSKGSLIATYRHPFSDTKTGKELGWQYFTSLIKNSGAGWVSLISYDREIFSKMSLITLGVGCSTQSAVLVLASEGLDTPLNPNHPSVVRSVFLPLSWQARVENAKKESNDRAAAFFKQEGEKAMKALRESPVPSKFIVPVQ